MENKRFRVGSIAVLFAVVVLCVAIFGTLTVVTAVSDARVAERYGQHVKQLYECENEGQRWLAQADAWLKMGSDLPENTRVEGEIMETEIISGSMRLEIRLEIHGQDYEILRWSCTGLWQPDDSLNLWQ